jgi:ACS family pantothenate transporter-like MFS transporter
MSMVQSILYTFWGIALYPATDAPYWKKGYIAMIVVVFAFFGATAGVTWVSSACDGKGVGNWLTYEMQLDKRSQRIAARSEEQVDVVHAEASDALKKD